MSGGAKFEYLWQDGTKYKKPTHLPAPQYIALLMDWVESQINDENVGIVFLKSKSYSPCYSCSLSLLISPSQRLFSLNAKRS